MNVIRQPITPQELFNQKAARRKDLAALPIEQKLTRLVTLQKIAYTIGRQVGREPQHRPWTIKTQSQ